MEKFIVWFRNSLHYHERLMCNFLRKRGWVVFYLDKPIRHCIDGFCWLKLYEEIK